MRGDPTVVTSIRPPASVVDAITELARARNISRCQAIRDLLDEYLDSERTQQDPHLVRRLYAELRSKLPERPLSFACRRKRLMTYKLAVRMLCARSLAGLLTLATADILGLRVLDDPIAA